MSEQEIRTKLRNWVADRSGSDQVNAIDDQTQIIDDGLLTSLDVVELILFIESIRDDEVDVDTLEPEAFTNIDSLISTFFADFQSTGSTTEPVSN